MTNSVLSTLAAGTLAGAALGLAATANVAPSGISSAESTINQLKSQGYQVVVNRVGTGPVDQITIRTVRPGQTYSRTDSGVPGSHNDVITTVTNKTVYIDLAC